MSSRKAKPKTVPAQRPIDVGRKRSGKHVNPRWRLSLSDEAWALVDQAAERAGESRSEWVRGALAAVVAQQLRLDASDTSSLFDRES